MRVLTVSPDCTRCGICANVCPMEIIRVDSNGPRIATEKMCIACGHCVAICPSGALDHDKTPLKNQIDLHTTPGLDTETASRFLRSRRSIRCYKQDTVPKDKLLQLLEIARFAPTGGNTQGLSYTVVTDRRLMEKLTEATIDCMEQLIKDKVPWIMPYSRIVAVYRNTKKDIILRGAPHLIVATAPKNFTIGSTNARYSLAYVELLAPTLGLGTCWAGFFELCAMTGYPKLHQLLNLDPDTAIVGAIMAGYPRYTYQRLVDRNPLTVAWI